MQLTTRQWQILAAVLILLAILAGVVYLNRAHAQTTTAPPPAPLSPACDAQLQLVEAGRRQAEQLAGRLYEQLQESLRKFEAVKPPMPPGSNPGPAPSPPPPAPPAEEKK